MIFFWVCLKMGRPQIPPKLTIFMGENEDKPADGTGNPGTQSSDKVKCQSCFEPDTFQMFGVDS